MISEVSISSVEKVTFGKGIIRHHVLIFHDTAGIRIKFDAEKFTNSLSGEELTMAVKPPARPGAPQSIVGVSFGGSARGNSMVGVSVGGRLPRGSVSSSMTSGKMDNIELHLDPAIEVVFEEELES